MKDWALIRNDGISFLDEDGLQELLENSLETYGVDTFLTELPERNYEREMWPDGTALLISMKVVVPKPVTTTWTVDE